MARRRKKSLKLGGGGRFQSIEEKAAREYGSKEAGERVAAAAGRAKYGKRKMAKLAAAGRKRRARRV